MRSLRCILGYHRWVYVGEQRTKLRFGWRGHNVECARCKRTAWFAGWGPV